MFHDAATMSLSWCLFLFADHRIVASFDVEKPVSFLEDNLLQLENDITDEISVPMIKVN